MQLRGLREQLTLWGLGLSPQVAEIDEALRLHIPMLIPQSAIDQAARRWSAMFDRLVAGDEE